MSHPAVVLFSGGQDSTTCLAWAIKEFGKDDIHTVSFDYGQKHSIEQACAQNIHDLLDMPHPHTTLDLHVLHDLGGAALTNSDIEVEEVASEESFNKFAHTHGLPSTFVPGRNMLFLTTAAAFAAQRGIYDLVTGVCEADAAGYPDCRAEFIHRAQQALSSALDDVVTIHAPLLKRNKMTTWALADELGVFELVRNETHTCYNGVHDEDHFHPWGFGCGACPACLERMNGYNQYTSSRAVPPVA